MPRCAYQWTLSVVLAVALVGCGGTTNPEAFGDQSTKPDAGNDSPNASGDGADSGANNSVLSVADLTLRTESLNLPSAANTLSEGILVTAIPTDAGGVIVENATVKFAASSGGFLDEPQKGGQKRYPTRVLFTQDPRERTIEVTATAGGASEQVAIKVTGTELVVQGPTTVPQGNQVTYTATLTNSAGEGIAGERIRIIEEGAAIETGAAGIATYRFNAAVSGRHTLTFKALEGTETDRIRVSVTQASFGFVTPAAETRVALGENITIKVKWIDRNGTPVDGKKVEFSSTRGMLGDTVVRATNGVAVTRISSSDPGPAIVTAATANNLRASIRLRFIATTPSQVRVGAEPTSVGPGETSTVTATVLDTDGNLVTGAEVEFSIVGSGTIYPATDKTDTTGQASTVYTAGRSAQPPSRCASLLVSTIMNPQQRSRTTLPSPSMNSRSRSYWALEMNSGRLEQPFMNYPTACW